MRTAVGIMADSKQQGPPFDPTQLTGLRLWFDASDSASITQVAGAVSQWSDKSGNNFHLAQAVGANQPITGTTTINGKNVLSFNGTTQYVSAPPPIQVVNPTNGEWSAYAVVRPAILTLTQYVLDQDSVAGGSPTTRCAVFIRRATTNLQALAMDTAGVVVIDITSGLVVNTPCYISSIRRPTEVEIYRNGTTTGPTATTGTPQTSGAYNVAIGAGRTGGVVASWWQGDIAEVLAYNVAHTTTDRQKVELYLKAKWGI